MKNRTQNVKYKKKLLTITYPNAKDKKKTEFYGYIIEKNSDIYTKDGKKVERSSITTQGSHIGLYVEEKKYQFDVSRLIYNLFSGEELLSSRDIIRYKDHNHNNKDFDNLQRISKKQFYNQFPPEKRGKKIDKNTAKKIKEEYDKGTQSRTLVRTKYGDETIPSYRVLAKKYKCSTHVINMILQDRYY